MKYTIGVPSLHGEDEVDEIRPSRTERRAKKREIARKSEKHYKRESVQKRRAATMADIATAQLGIIADPDASPSQKSMASQWIDSMFDDGSGNFANAMDSAVKVAEARARGDI